MHPMFELCIQYWYITGLLIILVYMLINDLFFQPKHAIRTNFPVIGRLRYLLEKLDLNYVNIGFPTTKKKLHLIEMKDVGSMRQQKERTTILDLVPPNNCTPLDIR